MRGKSRHDLTASGERGGDETGSRECGRDETGRRRAGASRFEVGGEESGRT
jgi:hypothetical protein